MMFTGEIIDWMCEDCGAIHGKHSPTEGTTWHTGKCDICREMRPVTEPRDFGYFKDPKIKYREVDD